jgi:A/G-specific adenine glycosylase
MKITELTNSLFNWYNLNKRDLPWRRTKDAYKVWVSEIILQQTRIEQGTPYYLKFIERFPTVTSLATASIEDVLLIWQGLGYYSRARNMHFGANQVVNDYQSIFPTKYDELLKLKGIGKYTAAAISSIVSAEKKAVVDGNVIRLISRLWGIEEPVDQLKTLAKIETFATQLIQNHDSGIMNQAMMEYGATVCVPRSPNCTECSLGTFCNAFKTEKQLLIPFKKGKTLVSQRSFQYLYISDNNHQFAIHQRVTNDIWQGLFELPILEKEKLSKDEIVEFLGFKPTSIKSEFHQKHQLSHQLISASLWMIKCSSEQLETLAKSKNYIITNRVNLQNYPVSKLADNFFLLIMKTESK